MDTQPLAYMSQEFLESGDARPLRIMAEYLEPTIRNWAGTTTGRIAPGSEARF